jgi:transposase
MKKGKRRHTAEFKAKMAVEALKDELSSAELASKYEVHPTRIAKWENSFRNQTNSRPILGGR